MSELEVDQVDLKRPIPYSNIKKKTLALFGSCNKETKSQEYWNTFSLYKPNYYFWVGDAVYSKDHSIESLKNSFNIQKNNKYYQNFIHQNNIEIDGVWDDHDFGINDGSGKNEGNINLKKRKDLYVDFIQTSGNENYNQIVSFNNGLYHTKTLLLDSNGNIIDDNIKNKNETTEIKFIYLDTRSFRDDYFIPSIGQYKFPFSALIASALRGLYSVLGWGRSYNGDLLGNDQWIWLEDTLKNSTSDFHVIVSSIQILTTNPVVESWNHYPIERNHLFQLLVDYDPNGLVLLSGDVHYSEISSLKYKRKSGKDGKWIEITSSGLTHSCSTSLVTKYLCPRMLKMFKRHRDHRNSYYMGKNFGSIEFNIEDYEINNNNNITKEYHQRKRLHFNIHEMDKSILDYKTNPKLKWSITSSNIINNNKLSDPIVSYQSLDFVHMPPFFCFSFYMLILSFIFLIFSKLFLFRKIKKD